MNNEKMYPFPWWLNPQMYYMYPNPFMFDPRMYNMYMDNYLENQQAYKLASDTMSIKIKDYGPEPLVIDIDKASEQNNNFRTVLWTGQNFQVTLMSIPVGEDIGLEVHNIDDQFIRIVDGQGIVRMGDSKDNLNFQKRIHEDYAIMIPAGKWHNIINTGNEPLKLYSIYAPPVHPRDTVHKTKADAQSSERYYR